MEEKKMVVIIPSYNNIQWYEKNLLSVMGQKYNNFRVIYIDDKSTDGTGDAVEKMIKDYSWTNIELIRNSEKKGALHNIYDAVHSCEDIEICVNCDGDDWFSGPQTLSKINKEYQNPDVWMSYGSYIDFPSNTRGCCKPYERSIVDTNTYNLHSWRSSHCRTYYVKLFKFIKKEDLYFNGNFAKMAWDCGYMWKMLSMSGGKFSYIHDILYVYNNHQFNDCKVNQQLQGQIDHYFRQQKPYEKIESLW